MKKMLKNCFLIICYISIFLSKAMAIKTPWEEFKEHFIEITHKYRYNHNLDEMLTIDLQVDEDLKGLRSEYNIPITIEGGLNLYYQRLKIKFMMGLVDKGAMEPKLVCRHFSIYFSGVLSEKGIKNWILIATPTQPGAPDGHTVNLYIDPRDNQLYVADGAGQTALNANELSFNPNTLAGFLIEQAKRQRTLDTFFLHQNFGFFIKNASRPLQKDTLEYIDAKTGKSMSYEEFNKDYLKYVSEHPLDKK